MTFGNSLWQKTFRHPLFDKDKVYERWKASDLDDRGLLMIIEGLCICYDSWSSTDEIYRIFSGPPDYMTDMPFKVIHAKLRRLLIKGFITGCDCGCRGDWELTSAGRAFAGISIPWRDNPCE
jgi:hypothetical protein